MKRLVKVAGTSNGASPRLDLPLWATRQIKDLSRRTGISQDKIRDMVLGFGLYRAKSELETVATLVQSAQTLATLNPSESVDEMETSNAAALHQPAPDQNVQIGQVDTDLPEIVRSGESRDTDPAPDDARPDHALERSDESGESRESNDFLAALSGE